MSMPGGNQSWYGTNAGVRPHAYDPFVQPELFEGVLARRFIAFLIDLFMIGVPLALFAVFILMFGIATLGLGWFLYFLLGPIAAIWALVYYGVTLGGPASATIGMRTVGLEMRTWYGERGYFLLGAVHAIGYWLTVTFLTPAVLLVALFNPRKRLLHDVLLGTVVINNEARAAMLRGAVRRT
jgi:uncharacterized RDD family membrane protein YckC